MAEENQNGMLVVDEGVESIDDTTYRKIFVGGLAWKTDNETMKAYFEQFGEIFEAVVINDKHTGKSKGYGFVTFKDPVSATRACEDPNPVIDGRRANCNLAYLGANRNRAESGHHQGMERASPARFMPQSIHGHQYTPHYSYPHPAYGYPYYPQDMSTMNYYNAYGGQQFPPYYNSVPSGSPGGYYYNCYPFYGQHGQTSSTWNPKMIQYPYSFPQQQHSNYGMSSVPTSSSSPSTSTAGLPATQPSTAVEGASNVQEERPSA